MGHTGRFALALLVAGMVCYSSVRQIPRDERGRIRRDRAAVAEFRRDTGYPKGRPGYVVDHIIPLKRGGCDTPPNMQWQTVEDARAKDRWE